MSETHDLLPNAYHGPLHDEQEKPKRQATVVGVAILWTSMIGFGSFALFQYALPALLQGNWKRWDITDAGLYRSNSTANHIMVYHIACGVVLQALGPIQLIPWVRRNYIQIHRILGRIYIGSALGASGLATLYVLLYRTSRNWIHEDVGNVLFGFAVFISACLSLWYIRKGDIESHRVWSIRLFLAVFGATVFRVATVPYFVAVILGAPSSQAVVNSLFYIMVFPSWIGFELVREKHMELGTKSILVASTIWAILTIIVFVGAWLPAILSKPSLQTGLFDE